MGIALIILIVIIAFWPLIMRLARPWLIRMMQRRAEDYMRRAAGMPPRDRERTRKNREKTSSGRESQGEKHSRRRRANSRHMEEPLIPKEYAEDVEYVEIKEFSSETIIDGDTGASSDTRRVKAESQVTDAEWEEIR